MQRIVVVTGAGQGLGLGIALRFGRAGAMVALAELDVQLGAAAADNLQGEGLAAMHERLDVRDPEQSTALVQKLVQQHGRIDVWVNNAGVARLAPAETMPRDYWDDSITTMLSGAFYCCQAAGRQMLSQGHGVIVNVASVTGMLHERERAAYSTAKAGVIALTEALGVEWADRGVRVVGIAPPIITLDGADPMINPETASLSELLRRTPLRRLGTIKEVAESVFFLASDEASYIVAETMRVDGGWTAYQLF